MGSMGRLEFTDTWKAPFLNGSISILLSPFLKQKNSMSFANFLDKLLYLVPSGNIHNLVFSSFRFSLTALSFKAACWGLDLYAHKNNYWKVSQYCNLSTKTVPQRKAVMPKEP